MCYVQLVACESGRLCCLLHRIPVFICTDRVHLNWKLHPRVCMHSIDTSALNRLILLNRLYLLGARCSAVEYTVRCLSNTRTFLIC